MKTNNKKIIIKMLLIFVFTSLTHGKNLRASAITSNTIQINFDPYTGGFVQILKYTTTISSVSITGCSSSYQTVFTQTPKGIKLTPDSNYFVRLCAITPQVGIPYTIQVRTGPPPPSNVYVTNIQANQLSVAWDDNSFQAVRYQVEFRAGNLYYNKLTASANNPPKQINATNLQSNTKYSITVQIITSNPIRRSSKSLTIFGVTVPGKANRPTASSSSSSSIDLKWSHVIEGTVQRKYTVTWYPPTKNGANNITEISRTSKIVTGLQSNQNYSFTIFAENEVGKGETSSVSVLCTIPSQPNSPRRLFVSSTSILLKWEEINEGPLPKNYTITLGTLFSGSSLMSKDGIVGDSEEITGLNPNTAYDIRLSARNKAGSSAPSNSTVIFTTPSRVENFSLEAVVSNTTQINFTFPFENEDKSLKFNYSLFTEDTLIKTIVGSNSYNASDLIPGVSYELAVIVIGRGGNSLPNQIQFTTTPNSVKNLKLSRSETNPSKEIDVEWDPPSGFGDNIVVEYSSLTIDVTNFTLFSFDKQRGSFRVEPGNNYTVTVFVKSNNVSSLTTTSLISSNPPALENVKSVWEGKDLILTWNKLNGNADNIVIEYSNQDIFDRFINSTNMTYFSVPDVGQDSDYLVVLYSTVVDVNGHTLRSRRVVISPDNTNLAGEVAAVVLLLIFLIGFNLFLFDQYQKRRKQQNSTEIIAVSSASSFSSSSPSTSPSPAPHKQVITKTMITKVEGRNIDTWNFSDFMKTMQKDENISFMEEFSTLHAIGRNQTTDVGSRDENKTKNRFKNILPYDVNRVRLNVVDGQPDSDYINASYISGLVDMNCYIATQAPIPSTIPDFWRMIWEEGSKSIVMLTKLVEGGRQKSARYWPNDQEEENHEMFSVKAISETQFSHYVIRIFQLKKDNETRSVRQFHFTSWPDKSVPSSTRDMVDFVRHVQEETKKERRSRLIVHCSAGVGRTGTFIAIDQLLQHLKTQDYVDIYGLVFQLRMGRTTMVQTEGQYIFIHKVVEDFLKGAFNINNIYDGVPGEPSTEKTIENSDV